MERDMNRIVPESFRGCAQVRAKGRTILSLCRGLRDLPNGIPNNPQTRFPTASAADRPGNLPAGAVYFCKNVL